MTKKTSRKKTGDWKVTSSTFIPVGDTLSDKKIVPLKVGDKISMKVFGGFCGPFTVTKVSPKGQRCDAVCALCGIIYTRIDTRRVVKTESQNLFHRDEGTVIKSMATYELKAPKSRRKKK